MPYIYTVNQILCGNDVVPKAEEAELAQKSPNAFYITKQLSIYHLNRSSGRMALQNPVEQFLKRFVSSLWASSKPVTPTQNRAICCQDFSTHACSGSVHMLYLSKNNTVWCKMMGHQVHIFHIGNR